MHQLFCITNNQQYNITPMIGDMSWQSSTDQLGVRLDFENAYNDDRYFPINPVDIGSIIILSNQAEIYRGVAVKENRSGRGAIQYNSFDFAFYLNKSKAVYQFRKMPADGAIKKMLGDFGVPFSITSIPIPISKIYSGTVVSDIIKDILEQAQKATGIKYRLEMRADTLYIEQQQDLIVTPTFKLCDIFGPYPVTAAVSNPTRSRSIEEMRNNIKLINNGRIVAEAKNDSLITQYGLLQEVRDETDMTQAHIIAANLLKDLGKIMEENSLELPGDDEVRAGRLLQVNEPVTGMQGQYLIKEATHTLKNGIHTMKLDLEAV